MLDTLAEMAERHGRHLRRIADLAASLAEQAHDDALAAPDPEARARSVAAFHRAARSLRQTLAIEARLMREHRALTHEATSDARREEEARVRERKERVRAGVVRLIWNEHEKPEAEELEAEVDERLGEHALLADDFMTAPIELLIGRLAAELGLSLPLAGALPTPAVSADSS